MATPKILLLSRKTLEHNFEKLQSYLEGVGVQMAVAVSPEDAQAAKKLTDAVAQFQYTTAIVADFAADVVIDDEGKTEFLGFTVISEKEPSLITEV